MRGDNLLIVDSTKYNTDGKEAKYIQINHIVGKLTANKKATEKHIKKSRIRIHVGFDDADIKNSNRPGADQSEK